MTGSLWPLSFSENDQPTIKSLLEEQSKFLPKLTGDLVYATITHDDKFDAELMNDFVFTFYLQGKFLDQYRFKVFSFAHDITMYPVMFRLDPAIARELGIKVAIGGVYKTEISNPQDLVTFIERVLKSDRVKAVVGSIMQLSKGS